MADVAIIDQVQSALDTDREAFQQQVDREQELIKSELAAGTFDNPQANIGLEYEFYAVSVADSETDRFSARHGGSLVRVPRQLLSMIGMEKELGLHNAEMRTSPQPCNEYGLLAQRAETRARLAAALEYTQAHGIQLVSDGLWTIPPEGETATEYLTATATEGDVTIATNMSESARYHAMGNTSDHPDLRLEAPHVSLSAQTVMPESLITSIQPHYQVPQAADLPLYHRYALRIAGPILALAVNGPFFPPDLYTDGTTLDDVLADGWADHRIPIFETVLNSLTPTATKVRFPGDIATVEEAVERIATDTPLVPMVPEETGRFDDQFAHFRHKHGTYWRWVRPVFDGPSESAANARLEFRPISGQPTVQDVISIQALFVGLMEALPRVEHPVKDLDWEHARQNFYAAMRDGLDAELYWLTNDGFETRDHQRLYDDLFAHARDGLRAAGLADSTVDTYLHPLRARVEAGITPAAWKRARAREAAADGADLQTAIETAQRAYFTQQRDSLLDGTFIDWIDP